MQKLTVITVCYNSIADLESTILNVLGLQYQKLDYIIIDGGSTDGTVELIRKYEHRLKCFVTERDRGIYDAMNKGWKLADQDSFILYLGAGDTIIRMPEPKSFLNADVVYGDVEIGVQQVYEGKHNFMLKLGNTIHHQAEFVRKEIQEEAPFSLDYKVYSDFNFNQVLLKRGVRFKKDAIFLSFALEGGISGNFDKREPLAIVRSNFGFVYWCAARLYYFTKKL
jgi:glycosyltransferase involved in cell wall biosynthesis